MAESISHPQWDLVYQSRSGPPTQPWLAPDILDHLRDLHARGIRNVVVAPLGFISDHLEVLFDLDTEAQELAAELGMKMVRAATVGTHPVFIGMLRQLIAERLSPNEAKLAMGLFGPNHDVCPVDCCPLRSEPVDLPLRQPQALRGRLNGIHAREALRFELRDFF